MGGRDSIDKHQKHIQAEAKWSLPKGRGRLCGPRWHLFVGKQQPTVITARRALQVDGAKDKNPSDSIWYWKTSTSIKLSGCYKTGAITVNTLQIGDWHKKIELIDLIAIVIFGIGNFDFRRNMTNSINNRIWKRLVWYYWAFSARSSLLQIQRNRLETKS